MQRLSSHDAGYLYLETSTALMHAAGLIIIDPSDAPDGFNFEKLRSAYANRLDESPAFRHRIVQVPLGLHHPVWVDDPDFDLDWHLRHVAVPSPGGSAELDELVAELITIPLDRTRALWETWLIEGLAGGRMAILNKVHHAAMAGTAGEKLMIAIFDDSPTGRTTDQPKFWNPSPIPRDPEMLGNAIFSLMRYPMDAVETIRRTVGSAVKTARGTRHGNDPLTRTPVSAPLTSLNGPLTHRRAFNRTTVSLGAVKKIKNAHGVTVNDVILALCAGALRHYLDHNGEHPRESLVALVPVSIKGVDDSGNSGSDDDRNDLSSILVQLATDIDDPIERLEAIHKEMRSATMQQDVVDAETLQDWTQYAAPVVAGRAARLYSRIHQTDNCAPTFNVPISNVPGPPFSLYVAGARVEAAFPIGPIFDGGALNISVMSYLENLDFSVVTCPDLVTDPSVLTDGITAALNQLSIATKAVAKQKGQAKSGAKKAAAKPSSPSGKGKSTAKKSGVKKAAAKASSPSGKGKSPTKKSPAKSG